MNSAKPLVTRYIFLELLDVDVNAILNGLKNILNEKRGNSNIHITVRGPYARSIQPADLDRYQSVLQQYSPLFIGNVGAFMNNNEQIVYLKVENDGLKKIWWKPNYPIGQYGFNPHITIYKGRNREFAQIVFEFLKKEDLTLLCHKFHLMTYTSNKNTLFKDDMEIEEECLSCFSQSEEDHTIIQNDILNLNFRGSVRLDILERALLLKNSFQSGGNYNRHNSIKSV